MLEIVLDSSDAVLLGTDQSLTKQKEVITRFRVTVDNDLLQKDAYLIGCMNFARCAFTLNDSPAEIINTNYRNVYENLSNTPMTDADWLTASAEAEKIYNTSMG
jgi:hypothetical protein